MKLPSRALALVMVSCTPAYAASTPSPFGMNWGYMYGYSGAPAGVFVPEMRARGGGFSRINLIWQQVEPTKGRFDWAAADAYVGQLQDPEEGFISLISASRWATQTSAQFMPATPAKDPDDYYRFIFETVKRYRGRVRYWANDFEPTNPAFWAGSKEQFVAQLRLFHRAVKTADPEAQVVLGGCDGLFFPPGMKSPAGGPMPPIPGQEAHLAFFDYVLEEAGDQFDVFDLRLYLSPYFIAPRVDYIRERMRVNGYEKPIFAGEYGGPGFFEFPENLQYLPIMSLWSVTTDEHGSPSVSPKIKQEIAKLYDKMSSLAPQTQMFMQGCPPELEEKLLRIQSRTLVMQNVCALAAGVKRALYWTYSPATNERDDIMGLMFAKFSLTRETGNETKFTITADTFRRMTTALAGVKRVKQVTLPQYPSMSLYAVDRGPRGTAYVVWEMRDLFTGEDAPAVECSWESNWSSARAVDALGGEVKVATSGGKITLPVGATPIFVEQSP